MTAGLQGAEALQKGMAQAGEDLAKKGAAALYQVANVLVGEAAERAPKQTGALRASAFVAEPVVSGSAVSVELGFGGPAAPYAVTQHEDTSLNHKEGEAKFLERVLMEHTKDLGDMLAGAMKGGA